MPRIVTDTMAYTNQCALKYDVYGEELRNSYLFQDLKESFLRQLSNSISPVMFFPGNYIVQHGDSDQSMYFVHRGQVDVLTVHPNLTETIHDVLHSGEMFGLPQGLFYGIPHHFSYRARTTVDIGVLQLKDWTDIMILFPRAKEVIYKRALAIYTIL
ncbi:hypothetical protein HHI36_005880 [Cryptolaemus montrouzieri]|uniref:Cyclic nucleotide-binding domain-containing protein n=1 Tax=Cryptolaemus montrouzieri TaxID=559131 RepID=A0ABD2NVN3_9CUCU